MWVYLDCARAIECVVFISLKQRNLFWNKIKWHLNLPDLSIKQWQFQIYKVQWWDSDANSDERKNNNKNMENGSFVLINDDCLIIYDR